MKFTELDFALEHLDNYSLANQQLNKAHKVAKKLLHLYENPELILKKQHEIGYFTEIEAALILSYQLNNRNLKLQERYYYTLGIRFGFYNLDNTFLQNKKEELIDYLEKMVPNPSREASLLYFAGYSDFINYHLNQEMKITDTTKFASNQKTYHLPLGRY